MTNFNPEIHHRKSTRLKGYDYTRPGYYFVTINLDNIRCMFAGWKNGLIELFPVGETVNKYWHEIPQHYPDVTLDEFLIMPNHVHGIIVIRDVDICNNVKNGDVDCQCKDVNNGDVNYHAQCKGVQLNAPTVAQNDEPIIVKSYAPDIVQSNTSTVNTTPNPHFAKISPSGRSLAVIIRNFKATVKHWCNENNYPQFKWQRNYHEHIIRNEEELCRIRDYIHKNPVVKQSIYPGLKR